VNKVNGSEAKNTPHCSFCGKSPHEVRKLIAGPTVFICDECVELCVDIIHEENKSALVESRDGTPTPKEIRKARRRRAGEVKHPADRPDRLRQDAAGADAGAHHRRAVHDGGCDHAH
jgi:hypothetical protein